MHLLSSKHIVVVQAMVPNVYKNRKLNGRDGLQNKTNTFRHCAKSQHTIVISAEATAASVSLQK